MREISSRDNATARELAQLSGSARERRKRGMSVIEGVHLCAAYLDGGGAPRDLFVTRAGQAHPEVAALLARSAVQPTMLADALFRSISALENGVGVLMLIDTPRPRLPARIDADCVYLDRLQDPGNVGTVLRTCAAVKVRRVFTAPGTAWCWSPKVLRAGMGAHFHLDLHESVAWDEIAARIDVAVRAAVARQARALWEVDLRAPAIWLFGQEGGGLDARLLASASQRVAIPQSDAVESLNVGVAAALCLYEQMRQRTQPG
ncbi:MAG: RNA methyltransferase [Burkholderiaceae bacterium]|nr:RNA methyltransferase [Burkholderiaceae bacterium]